MKKISLFLVMLFLIISIHAAGLNNTATKIKEASPEVYEVVKAKAVDKWYDNHAMVVYEINKQCDAMIMCDKLFDSHAHIAYGAFLKWYDGDASIFDGTVNIYTAYVDWTMVEYEARKQIAAESSY